MSSAEKFTESQHVNLYVRDLRPHPRVQRQMRPAWARKIRDEFDPDKFGEIAVVKVGDEYFVFDGQHRLWAARAYLGDNQRVPCVVYREMPEDRQADLFLGRNSVKQVRAIDKFKMAVVAGRTAQSRISEILNGLKLAVGENRAAGCVRATAALEKVYLRYGESALLRALCVIRSAWEHNPDAYDGTIIKAVSYLVYRCGADLDDEELGRKLARGGGPSQLLGAARDLAKAAGGSVERAAAERVLNIYNKGRRTKTLSFAAAANGRDSGAVSTAKRSAMPSQPRMN